MRYGKAGGALPVLHVDVVSSPTASGQPEDKTVEETYELLLFDLQRVEDCSTIDSPLFPVERTRWTVFCFPRRTGDIGGGNQGANIADDRFSKQPEGLNGGCGNFHCEESLSE